MSQTVFQRNFTQNPLLVEAKRFRRRFLGESKHTGIYRLYTGVAGVIYLLLIGIAIANRQAFSSGAIIEFQTGLFCLIVPALTYGAIAGEREKRTWELLVVAPLSKAQIIIGKFLSAGLVILTVAAMILPIVAICFNRDTETKLGVVFGYLDSVAFALGFAAICVFISSRTHRSLTAQVLIYSTLFVWLLVFPALVSAASLGSQDRMLWFHPFFAVWALCSGLHPGVTLNPLLYGPVAQGLLYLFIIVVALEAAIHSISTGDGVSGRLSDA